MLLRKYDSGISSLSLLTLRIVRENRFSPLHSRKHYCGLKKNNVGRNVTIYTYAYILYYFCNSFTLFIIFILTTSRYTYALEALEKTSFIEGNKFLIKWYRYSIQFDTVLILSFTIQSWKVLLFVPYEHTNLFVTVILIYSVCKIFAILGRWYIYNFSYNILIIYYTV